MAVTIKDIAKRAGVSKTTVSRALNNQPRISQETKERIVKFAEEMNYRHNQLATSLRSKKSMVIGLIFPGFMAGHFYAEIFHGIESYCTRKGFGVLIGSSDGLSNKEEEIIKLLQERRVDGLIIAPTQGVDLSLFQQLKKENVPFVFIDKYLPDVEADRIVIDNIKGAYLAVNHLIKRGHNKVAFLSGPESPCITIEERFKGYKMAFMENNIEFQKYIKTDQNVYNQRKSGYKAVKKLLETKQGITAIFAINDSLAIGAMKAVREAGLIISDDIAIIGFNEDDISFYLEKPLTTISVPKFEMGRKAAQLLINRIERKETGKAKVYKLEPELVVGETS